MKILHLNAGNETGGGMHHILGLLNALNREEFVLGVLEKGELYKRATSTGIRTVHFSSNTRMSIPLLHKMIRYIKREKISVVHTHGPRANVYANILKKLVSFHWIVTVHSDPRHDFKHKRLYGHLLTKLNVRAVKNANRVIAISDPFRSNLTKAGVEDQKIVTALNGIDFRKKTDKNYVKTDYGFSEKDFLFLMVARLEPVKGHHIAIKAIAEVVKQRENCHLLLLGNGSLQGELKTLARKLGIEAHVHFLGHRDDADCFYHMADITMLTSFSESFPLVLLESARAKTPVITTDVGGIGELIPNKSLGWRTNPGNVRDLTLAMGEALFFHKKNMLHLMGNKLHSHASSRFSVEIFAENVYNVYKRIDM